MSTNDDYTVTVKTVFDKTQTKKDWNKLLKELQKEILLKVKVDNKMDTTNLKAFRQQLIEISKEAVAAREAIRNMGTELSNVQISSKTNTTPISIEKQTANTTTSPTLTSNTSKGVTDKISDVASVATKYNALYLAATNTKKIIQKLQTNYA